MRKTNLRRVVLGMTVASLMFTALAGCVVYDPYPGGYYYGGSYSYRPYYYRPYYYYPYRYRHWGD